VGKWILNITRIFIDWINISEHTQTEDFFLIVPFSITLLLLIGYAIYYLCRSTPKSSWLFVLSLTFSTGIVLIILDVISGGRRSGVARYMIPTFLGIQLMIAYLLSSKLIYQQGRIAQKMWICLTILLLANGVVSDVIISSSEMWWNKGSASNGNLHQLASIINKAPHPLVVSDAQFPTILGLMHILKPETNFQLTNQPNKLMIFDNRENIFLFEPSKILQKSIQTNYAIQAVYIGKNSIPTLGKIVSQNSSY
jgi:uncharacterized membrane protein